MRLALATCAAGLALLASATPALAAQAARLQGTWTMAGRVTRADGVRGEHRGQRVQRRWSFFPRCASGPCKTVDLIRERSAGKTQHLVLRATGRGRYSGRGTFPVPLRCAGHVYPHGGKALAIVHVRIARASVVQSTPFATAVRATYRNPKRTNHTRCPGALGRDGGVYSGGLSSPLPAPPLADFGAALDAVTGTVAFTDASRTSAGAPVSAWSWNFGDPASGSANTSTLQNPAHHYAAPGNYTITLTVRDANGLTATVTRQIVG